MQSIILICSNDEFLKDISVQYNDADVYKLDKNNRYNIETMKGEFILRWTTVL